MAVGFVMAASWGPLAADPGAVQNNYWRIPFDDSPHIVATAYLSELSIGAHDGRTGIAVATFKRFEYLDDAGQTSLDELNDVYVLVNFRPAVTKKNWRMDCGVAGYDNTFGLPPFFPTRLRFEDYIYRLWVQQEGVVAAHVDAAQTHTKSNYMRNPVAAEIFNEEVSNLLKRKIKATVSRLDELGVSFDYEGEVTGQDAREILDKIAQVHSRALEAAGRAATPQRAEALRLFAANLNKAFYGFEPDFFQQNLLRIVDDVISVIKGSIELWPTLVEICYFHKNRKGLPQVRVKNRKA